MANQKLALVRVLSDKYPVPVDGQIEPISEVPFLRKEDKSPFYFEMRNLLRRKGMLGDFENPMSQEQIEAVMSEFMPYSSSYNSMTLWTINGMVPDDNFATFSKKSCVVIADAEEQLENGKIVSMAPTDVAIHGATKVSNGIMVITKARYDTLSQEEKDMLSQTYSNVRVCDTPIREAVDEELIAAGYTAETLSLERADKGYKESRTSADVQETIARIAGERGIPLVLHYNVITGEHDEVEKLEQFKNDKLKLEGVKLYYKQSFFEYLSTKMDIDSDVLATCIAIPDSEIYMEQLCDEIGRIGIDKYKQVLGEYNRTLESLRGDGTLPTPQQIIDSIEQNKKIDLVSLVNQRINVPQEYSEKRDVLIDAIETTEGETRFGVLEEQNGTLTRGVTKSLTTDENGMEIK